MAKHTEHPAREKKLRHARIKELFFRATELSQEAWRRFLEEECGDDGELRTEVESLLQHHCPGDLPEDFFRRERSGKHDG